jgi:alkylhydroperoxidase/carboxymuconolactone decarboxylase family protein YurZ
MKMLTTVFLFGLSCIAEAQAMDGALSARQQGIISISAYTANGDLDKLKTALNEGLDAGLTVNEIKEILVQLYAYTGFPRSLNGIHVFMTVLDERRAKGIEDEIGKEATLVPAGLDKGRVWRKGTGKACRAGNNPAGPRLSVVCARD